MISRGIFLNPVFALVTTTNPTTITFSLFALRTLLFKWQEHGAFVDLGTKSGHLDSGVCYRCDTDVSSRVSELLSVSRVVVVTSASLIKHQLICSDPLQSLHRAACAPLSLTAVKYLSALNYLSNLKGVKGTDFSSNNLMSTILKLANNYNPKHL